MEKLGFEFVGTKKSSYFKDDEILISKEYHGTKELFLNRNNSIKKKQIFLDKLLDKLLNKSLQYFNKKLSSYK